MILDTLKNGKQYSALHPDFEKALKFVTENATTIPVGRYAIDGDNVFVTVVETDLRRAEDAPLEAHREYIDIQIVLDGMETFGWSALSSCVMPTDEYDKEKDIIFFNDHHKNFVTAMCGQFVIFFPEDAHAPLIGKGRVRKAIVKIKTTK